MEQVAFKLRQLIKNYSISVFIDISHKVNFI